MIKIHFKTLSGLTHTLKKENPTSEELYKFAAESNKCGIDEVRLLFNGKDVDDNNIPTVDKSIIFIIMKISGGASTISSKSDLSKLDNKKVVIATEKSPKWSLIRSGLNIVGQCDKLNCPTKVNGGKFISVNGFVELDMIKHVLECTGCGQESVLPFVSFILHGTLEYKITGEQIIQKDNTIKKFAKRGELTSTETKIFNYDSDGDDLTEWKKLTINVFNPLIPAIVTTNSNDSI